MKTLMTYKPSKGNFTKITYAELVDYINEHDFSIYRGYKDIETGEFFAKIMDMKGKLIQIKYDSLEESKYVEHYLKQDFKDILHITPVPDNYVGHIPKTSIAVSKLCKQMLLNIKEDGMSYEDVIFGLMAHKYYDIY